VIPVDLSIAHMLSLCIIQELVAIFSSFFLVTSLVSMKDFPELSKLGESLFEESIHSIGSPYEYHNYGALPVADILIY